jgi:soluble P-type ATPase
LLHRRSKPGVLLEIPGFGDRHITTLLSDYDGSLSCGGTVTDQIKRGLTKLAQKVDVHILTADRKVKSKACFGGLPLTIHILSPGDQDVQKRDYLKDFKPADVAVFGNGNNDRLLMQAVKENGGLCVAISNGEGCAIDALLNAHLLVHGALEALRVLLEPDRFAATLRCCIFHFPDSRLKKRPVFNGGMSNASSFVKKRD